LKIEVVIKKSNNQRNGIKKEDWSKWHKTSYEYDEHDIYPDTIFIDEINLDKGINDVFVAKSVGGEKK